MIDDDESGDDGTLGNWISDAGAGVALIMFIYALFIVLPPLFDMIQRVKP